MSVTVQLKGSLCIVAILGRLDTAEQRGELLSALQGDLRSPGGAVLTLELNFYDADHLPADVVEAMAARIDGGSVVKIIAYHALLAHSLTRLNMPVRLVSNPVQRTASVPCRALALAGSAQSLDKMLQVMATLPKADVAIFVLQHVLEDQPHLLDQLLKTRTDYRVIMPQNLMPVQGGTLYVAPPGHHMKVAHGLIYLTRDRKIQFARPSIDELFDSLASEYGASAIAVLLCGYGQDGVAGCAALRRAGATVIVQDGCECEPARVMPDSARDAGHFDYLMKCSAIASVVAVTVAGHQTPPSGTFLELFLLAVLDQYGYDFRGYQRDSLERRIKNLMVTFRAESFSEFQCEVLSNAALFERLCSELSVGVTQFFRHPEQFQILREEVLPFLASFSVVKLWSAGCATGEEAYSLAMLLSELGMLERSHLFATDINHHFLEQAKSGLFPSESLVSSRSNYAASGGVRQFDEHVVPCGRFFKVNDALHQRILVHRHSLVDSGVFNEFQLIMCRNVLIYFNAELQRQVLQQFARSLHADGFLVLGPQDGLTLMAQEQGFVTYKNASHIYRLQRRSAYD